VAVPGNVGENVRIWMHSGRLLLGTFTVDASGTAVVTIPMDASLGTTRIVVQSLDGTLIGWDGMVITAATSAAASTTASDDDLASTGTDATLALGLGGLLLALGAVLFAARRRRAQG
jgi:LPXTG-motif cell wall-anchored protein